MNSTRVSGEGTPPAPLLARPWPHSPVRQVNDASVVQSVLAQMHLDHGAGALMVFEAFEGSSNPDVDGSGLLLVRFPGQIV